MTRFSLSKFLLIALCLLPCLFAGSAKAALPTVSSGTLVFDMNPDVTSFTNGQSVTTLTDQSATGLVMTGTAPNVPTIVTNAFGTHNALANTGSQSLNGSAGIPGAAAGGYTMFVVQQYTPTATNGAYAIDMIDGLQIYSQSGDQSPGIYSPSGFKSVGLSPNGVGTLPPQVLEFVLNGSTSLGTVYRNGFQVNSTFAYTDASLSGAVQLGGSAPNSWNGNMGRFLIYRGVLTATDRAAVEAYLQTTYGVGAAPLPANTISASSSHLFFSPYGWRTSTNPSYGYTEMTAINTGNYFKTVFTGTSLGLALDPSPILQKPAILTSTYPVLRCILDNGQPFDVQETAAGYLPIVQNLPAGTHTFQATIVRFAGGNGDFNDASGVCHCLRVAGIVLDSGGVLSDPVIKPKRAVYFGDSITAGTRAISVDITFAGEDGAVTAAKMLCDRLNAEYGIIGFPGQGFEVAGGAGNSNIFPNAWNVMQTGYSRSFSTVPDYLFEAMGANAPTTQTDVTNWLAAVRTALPTTKILCVSGNGTIAGYVTTATTASGDTNTFNVAMAIPGTGGAANVNTYDGLHPNTAGHQAFLEVLLPAVSALLPTAPLNPAPSGTKRRIQ